MFLVWFPLNVSLWHTEVFRRSLEVEGRERGGGGRSSTVPDLDMRSDTET